jgi:hypothetical protein
MASGGYLLPAVSDDLLIAPQCRLVGAAADRSDVRLCLHQESSEMPARLRLKGVISHLVSKDRYARSHGKMTFTAATSRR